MRRLVGARHDLRGRGQVLVLFALGLVVMLAFAAVAVDVGYWLAEKRGLQNAADAAARLPPISAPSPHCRHAARHAMEYVNDQPGPHRGRPAGAAAAA
jgi:uncharacterized membrane protein